jgi:hypothetical protein
VATLPVIYRENKEGKKEMKKKKKRRGPYLLWYENHGYRELRDKNMVMSPMEPLTI